MSLKYKALLFNFIGFALIFILIRTGLTYFIPIPKIYFVIIAAVVASVIAPKFAVARVNGKEKLMMKWVFKKGVKEL